MVKHYVCKAHLAGWLLCLALSVSVVTKGSAIVYNFMTFSKSYCMCHHNQLVYNFKIFWDDRAAAQFPNLTSGIHLFFQQDDLMICYQACGFFTFTSLWFLIGWVFFSPQGCLSCFQCFAYIYFTVNLLNFSSIWLEIWVSFVISEIILNDPIHEHSIFVNLFRSLNYITVNFLPQKFISTIVLQA